MKRFKTLLLATAALLCSIAVQAYDFKVDSICYQITSEEELTVTVTYQGSTFMLDNNYSGSLTIPLQSPTTVRHTMLLLSPLEHSSGAKISQTSPSPPA